MEAEDHFFSASPTLSELGLAYGLRQIHSESVAYSQS